MWSPVWGLKSGTVRSWSEPKSRVGCLTDWTTQEPREINLERSCMSEDILTLAGELGSVWSSRWKVTFLQSYRSIRPLLSTCHVGLLWRDSWHHHDFWSFGRDLLFFLSGRLYHVLFVYRVPKFHNHVLCRGSLWGQCAAPLGTSSVWKLMPLVLENILTSYFLKVFSTIFFPFC